MGLSRPPHSHSRAFAQPNPATTSFPWNKRPNRWPRLHGPTLQPLQSPRRSQPPPHLSSPAQAPLPFARSPIPFLIPRCHCRRASESKTHLAAGRLGGGGPHKSRAPSLLGMDAASCCRVSARLPSLRFSRVFQPSRVNSPLLSTPSCRSSRRRGAASRCAGWRRGRRGARSAPSPSTRRPRHPSAAPGARSWRRRRPRRVSRLRLSRLFCWCACHWGFGFGFREGFWLGNRWPSARCCNAVLGNTAAIQLGEPGAVFVSFGSSVEGFEENLPVAVVVVPVTDAVFT